MDNQIFWSALGAGIGSFFGVILFFVARYGIEVRRSRKSLIKSYLCASVLNQGQLSESYGELLHHHGRRVLNPASVGEPNIQHPLWDWSRDVVGTQPPGDSTIYGPYTTDFDEPGLYCVLFSIKGVGLARPPEIINDLILMELDVCSTIPHYTPFQGGVQQFREVRKIARRFIRISDLAQGGWISFEIRFHSDCQGTWEYRALVYDGLGGRPDTLATLGRDVRLFFDTVSIYRLKQFRLPWD
jgi:hypothetical protein